MDTGEGFTRRDVHLFLHPMKERTKGDDFCAEW